MLASLLFYHFFLIQKLIFGLFSRERKVLLLYCLGFECFVSSMHRGVDCEVEWKYDIKGLIVKKKYNLFIKCISQHNSNSAYYTNVQFTDKHKYTGLGKFGMFYLDLKISVFCCYCYCYCYLFLLCLQFWFIHYLAA